MKSVYYGVVVEKNKAGGPHGFRLHTNQLMNLFPFETFESQVQKIIPKIVSCCLFRMVDGHRGHRVALREADLRGRQIRGRCGRAGCYLCLRC